jgi:hypothetical protein
MDRMSESGLPIDAVYDESKLTDVRLEEKLGYPGEYPFTRGPYPHVNADRPWTAGLCAIESITDAVEQAAQIDSGNRTVARVSKFTTDAKHASSRNSANHVTRQQCVMRLKL